MKHQLQTFPALSNAQALHIAAGKLQLTRDSNWETLGSYHWTIDFRLEANDTTPCMKVIFGLASLFSDTC